MVHNKIKRIDYFVMCKGGLSLNKIVKINIYFSNNKKMVSFRRVVLSKAIVWKNTVISSAIQTNAKKIWNSRKSKTWHRTIHNKGFVVEEPFLISDWRKKKTPPKQSKNKNQIWEYRCVLNLFFLFTISPQCFKFVDRNIRPQGYKKKLMMNIIMIICLSRFFRPCFSFFLKALHIIYSGTFFLERGCKNSASQKWINRKATQWRLVPRGH